MKNQKAFKAYLQEVFSLSGETSKEASSKADLLFNLEKRWLQCNGQKKKPITLEAMYNEKTWDEVKALVPNLPIAELVSELGLQNAPTTVVSDPDALKNLNELYQEKNLDALKALLQYRVIAHYNAYLSSNLIEAKAKYDGVATGAVDTPSQKEVAQAAIDANFSDMIGKVYVKHHFQKNPRLISYLWFKRLKRLMQSESKQCSGCLKKPRCGP